MQAFRTMLNESNMLAYLAMMALRLMELKRVMKESGSIYLHCDPTASHYLKLLLDEIFRPGSFRSEVDPEDGRRCRLGDLTAAAAPRESAKDRG